MVVRLRLARRRRYWWPSGVYGAYSFLKEERATRARGGIFHSDSAIALAVSRRKAKRALTPRQ